MKSCRYILLICALAAMPFQHTFAQKQGCDEQLKSLLLLFEAGKYDQVIKQYEATGTAGCSGKQEELLNEVIASAYLEIDKLEPGLAYIRTIFKNNPYYYTATAKYSLEPFIANLNRFRVRPLFALGVQAGYDVPVFLTSVRRSVITNDLIKNPDSGAKPRPSFHVGLNFQYYLLPYLTLVAELNYQQINYRRTIDATGENEIVNGFRNTVIEYNEKSSYLTIPIYAKLDFAFKKAKLYPSVLGGVYYRNMFRSSAGINAEMERYVGDDLNNLEFLPIDEAIEGIDTRDLRNRHQWGPLVGFSLAYRKNYYTFFVDARYYFDVFNYEKEGGRYSNYTLTDYYYVDNTSRMTNVQINVGFTYNLIHQIKQMH